MNSIELTILIIIAIGIFIFIISQKNFLKVYDWKKDYITTGLCARCKHFDKYSRLCFSGEHSMWSERQKTHIYWTNTPCDGKCSCRDFNEGELW
jgi:hypothetical protein